jgi:hypothetical protein
METGSAESRVEGVLDFDPRSMTREYSCTQKFFLFLHAFDFT